MLLSQKLLRELDDYPIGRPHGRMQRLQAITERGVGLRVQVAVAVQRKPGSTEDH